MSRHAQCLLHPCNSTKSPTSCIPVRLNPVFVVVEAQCTTKGSSQPVQTITVTDEAITDLANKSQHSVSLADLVK